MQRSALCRSRRELSNAYLVAKFRFDTAENEPCKICRIPRACLGARRAALGGLEQRLRRRPEVGAVLPGPEAGAPVRRGLGAGPLPDGRPSGAPAPEPGHLQKMRFGSRAGSFSAVSKRDFARKYAFDSIFQARQHVHTFAPLQSQNFNKNRLKNQEFS